MSKLPHTPSLEEEEEEEEVGENGARKL